jgi:hypothetical protein
MSCAGAGEPISRLRGHEVMMLRMRAVRDSDDG